MNVTSGDNESYVYDLVIELGELIEPIELPELPTEDLSLEVLERYAAEGKKYNLIQNCYEDMIGKFYIPVLFPLVDKGDGPEIFLHDSPKTANIIGNAVGEKYKEYNYISLVIPKYIVMQFRDFIPAGTKFLIGFSGEHKKISNLNVIGLYGADL